MRDTLEMAFEAELICAIDDPTAFWPESHDMTDELKAFEALVRADERSVERNRFAILCNEIALDSQIQGLNRAVSITLNTIASKIRARGNT